jgi:hypothetical protein
MPLTLTKVHVTEKVPNTDQSRVTRVNHYVRLYADNGPPCYLQNGEVYSEGGPLIDPPDYPTWLWGEINKLSPQALESVHFTIPEDRVVVPARNEPTGRQRNRR